MCTRRDFLKTAGAATVVGPALLTESAIAAAQARAGEAAAGALFDFHKVADGVFLAQARPQLMINSNATVIVNEDDVMVIDTHSKPSAARALIGQIRREITPKPVRYIVNSHFHWDHVHGNGAYPPAFRGGVHIIASEPTRKLLADLSKQRIQGSLDDAQKQIADFRSKLEKADAKTRLQLKGLIAQGEAYIKEMGNATVELPTTTFDRTLVIHKKNREIHLMFLGRGHTAGDVIVFLPRERVIATGDLTHGFLPWIGDSYPNEWPKTLDAVLKLDFARVSPGHAAVQDGKTVISNFRSYVDELSGAVRARIQRGQSLAQVQKEVTTASLKSLQSGGYMAMLRKNYEQAVPVVAGNPHPFEASFAGNVEHVYRRLKG